MEEDGIIEPLTDGDLTVSTSEATSDYEPSDRGTTFGSLSSSVCDHVWEYGRRYHAFRPGRYPIPNDEEEYRRETLRHQMFKELLKGKLYLAPIGDNPQKIIDLGTGFGDWAIEIGEMFPGARVTGVDLSPIQPVWIPPNVEFIVDDIEDEWVHDKDYDFVHLRFVNIVLKDNVSLFRKIFENLKPGGWVEVQDALPRVSSDDGTVTADNPVNRFYDAVRAVLRDQYGFDIEYVERLPAMLQSLGFVNVQRRVLHVPLGEWAKDAQLRVIGGYLREVLMDFVGAMAARPLVEAGLEQEEIADMTRSVAAAAANRRIHGHIAMHFVWAQKPLLA
ncbi:hypothetical protein VTK26DRAFT_8066 [Humicola hyalothermophila]